MCHLSACCKALLQSQEQRPVLRQDPHPLRPLGWRVGLPRSLRFLSPEPGRVSHLPTRRCSHSSVFLSASRWQPAFQPFRWVPGATTTQQQVFGQHSLIGGSPGAFQWGCWVGAHFLTAWASCPRDGDWGTWRDLTCSERTWEATCLETLSHPVALAPLSMMTSLHVSSLPVSQPVCPHPCFPKTPKKPLNLRGALASALGELN